MRKTPLLALATLIALASFALTFSACTPKPGQEGGPPKIVDCGVKAVTDHAIDALPGVNRCLSGTSSITDCLLGLVQPALGITFDTIACVTRHEGAAASAAAQTSGGERDARRAARAKEFLEGQRVRFSD